MERICLIQVLGHAKLVTGSGGRVGLWTHCLRTTRATISSVLRVNLPRREPGAFLGGLLAPPSTCGGAKKGTAPFAGPDDGEARSYVRWVGVSPARIPGFLRTLTLWGHSPFCVKCGSASNRCAHAAGSWDRERPAWTPDCTALLPISIRTRPGRCPDEQGPGGMPANVGLKRGRQPCAVRLFGGGGLPSFAGGHGPGTSCPPRRPGLESPARRSPQEAAAPEHLDRVDGASRQES
jgi:hypothetical protein